MQPRSPPTTLDWPTLIPSLLLFAINAILALVVLGSVLDDLQQLGRLAGLSVFIRLIPAAALASAFAGGALAYATMGYVAARRIQIFQAGSAVCAALAIALVLTKAIGSVFGFL